MATTAERRAATATLRAGKRVVLNRAALSEVTLAVADGLFELGKAIVEDAKVPDAPPYGKGLVERRGAVAFVKGGTGPARLVAFSSVSGRPVTKPRMARIPAASAVVVFGYGFPGRFLEHGTARMPARPFLTPSLMAHIGDLRDYVHESLIRRGTGSRAIRKAELATAISEGQA